MLEQQRSEAGPSTSDGNPTTTTAVTYVTDQPNRVLVIEGEDRVYNQAGRIVSKIQPTRLEFRDYRCTIELYNGPSEKHRGKAVIHGDVQGMDYEELIEVVEGHRFYGRRFWRAGKGPRDLRPTLEELRAEIEGADKDRLRELLAEERATHNRRDALALITDAALGDAAGTEDPDGGTDLR